MGFAGFDIGYTRTKGACADAQGNPHVFRNDQGALYTRSAVFLEPDGNVLVGEEAYNAGLVQPERYCDRFKRALGTQEVLVSADGVDYTAKDLTRLLLKFMSKSYERHTGEVLTEVALSVPAQWTDAQRVDTEEAARLAGLDVTIVVSEPTCAVLGSDLQKRQGLVAVLDLGGGTFDVSLVDIQGDTSTVLTTHGDAGLGGEDFTDCLVELARDTFESDHGVRLTRDSHPMAYHELVARAEQAKVTLSLRDQAQIVITADGRASTCTVTRAQFQQATQALVNRAMACAQETFEQQGIDPGSVTEFLAVGGASQMPHFLEGVEATFSMKPSTQGDPFFSVVSGAFLMGRLEIQRRDGSFTDKGRKLPNLSFKVNDVTTHDFGVAVLNHDETDLVNDVVLERGQPIPSKHHKAFQLSEPNQTEARIQVLQGPTGKLASECQVIGEFELTGLTPIPGAHRIDISMHIDRNGVLSAEAWDPHGDQQAELAIHYGKKRKAA